MFGNISFAHPSKLNCQVFTKNKTKQSLLWEINPAHFPSLREQHPHLDSGGRR